MEQSKKETTLFEDLANCLTKQEEEDNKILSEEYKTKEQIEEEAIEKTQVDFIDDGKFDYDSKSQLKFKIGDNASHFGLSCEDLDKFSAIYEKTYKLSLSQAVYNKSLRDQIKQKGIKASIEQASQLWESMLNKLCDLKMLDFLIDQVKLDENIKKQIMTREVDKLFGSQINPSTKKDLAQNEILGQLQTITRTLKKRI